MPIAMRPLATPLIIWFPCGDPDDQATRAAHLQSEAAPDVAVDALAYDVLA